MLLLRFRQSGGGRFRCRAAELPTAAEEVETAEEAAMTEKAEKAAEKAETAEEAAMAGRRGLQ